MIGSFLIRGLVMIFGYAYPAYECFKTVEKNKPEIEHLRFWCQYWILVATMTVCERIGDAFVSWVPMYSEAKLAFFIYLWYPKTKGTTYIYDSFFRPYVAKHEPEIDRNLLELRTRAGDIAVSYWQKVAGYGQTRIFEILQYVAAQSTPKPRPVQTQQEARVSQTSTGPNSPAPITEPQTQEQASPTSNPSPAQHQEAEVSPPEVPAPTPTVQSKEAVIPKPASSSGAEPMHIDIAPPCLDNGNANPAPQETVLEETLRATRNRLRRTRAAPSVK